MRIDASGSAVFSNWIPFRRQIEQLGLVQGNNVIVDLDGTSLVDSSVMEKHKELTLDFEQAGRRLDIVGLEGHRQGSTHPLAARKRVTVQMRRVTAIGPAALEPELVAMARGVGAPVYTSVPCTGGGSRPQAHADRALVRFETIVPADVAAAVLRALREPRFSEERLTVWIEPVDMMRLEQL